jgi:hypothetical protein
MLIETRIFIRPNFMSFLFLDEGILMQTVQPDGRIADKGKQFREEEELPN